MKFWNFQESARSVLSVLSAETLSVYMRPGERGDVYFVFAGILIYQTCPYLNYRPGGTAHKTRFLGRGGAFNILRSIIHEEVHAKALKWDLH